MLTRVEAGGRRHGDSMHLAGLFCTQKAYNLVAAEEARQVRAVTLRTAVCVMRSHTIAAAAAGGSAAAMT